MSDESGRYEEWPCVMCTRVLVPMGHFPCISSHCLHNPIHWILYFIFTALCKPNRKGKGQVSSPLHPEPTFLPFQAVNSKSVSHHNDDV